MITDFILSLLLEKRGDGSFFFVSLSFLLGNIFCQQSFMQVAGVT